MPSNPTPTPRDAATADMRIEVVKRELNQGALAGFDSAVTAYAAQLVVAALDSFDVAALKAEYERGVRHGKVVQTIFGNSVENLQAEYERGIAEGRRQATEDWERQYAYEGVNGITFPVAGDDLLRARASIAVRAADGKPTGRLLSRAVGPWETDEQPEPAGGAS